MDAKGAAAPPLMSPVGLARRSSSTSLRRPPPPPGEHTSPLSVDTGGKRSRLSCRCSGAGPFPAALGNGSTGCNDRRSQERGAREVRPGRARVAGARAAAADASSCCDRSPPTVRRGAGGEVPADALAASRAAGNRPRWRKLKPRRDGVDSDPRRHRRLLSAPRSADRQGVRARHDRRDAGAGRGEPAQERLPTRTSSRARSRNPLPMTRFDVVISNCVINLSATRTGCCARPSACSSRAAALPSGRDRAREMARPSGAA